MGLERGRGLCKRRQLVVLSERERKRGPDTVDKHLSLRLLKQACKWPVWAPPSPVNGLYSTAWIEMEMGMEMHTHHHHHHHLQRHPHPPSSPQSPLLILGWEMWLLPLPHYLYRAGEQGSYHTHAQPHTHTRARLLSYSFHNDSCFWMRWGAITLHSHSEWSELALYSWIIDIFKWLL